MISVMATVGIFLMNSVFGFYSDEFVTRMEDGFSDNVTKQLTDTLFYEDFAQLQKQLFSAYANVFGFDSGRNFYILDKNANVLASSDDSAGKISLTPNLMNAMNGKTSANQAYGAKFLDYARYVENGGNECIVYIRDDLSEMKELSFMQFSIIIQALMVGLIIALVMAFFLARAITGPVKTITDSTVQIASGEYSHRLKIRAKDEIGTLAKNFNTMAQVIENTLKELGYVVYSNVLNSMAHANVPQNRERLFIIGFDPERVPNYAMFKFPEPIALEKTIHDCINIEEKDEKLFYKKEHPYYPMLADGMVNPNTIYQWRRKYVRENQSNVCPTLTANMGEGGHNVPLIITPYGYRKLTPKECLNFQGYPEEYAFPDIAQSKKYKQVGNSVTVPLIQRVAQKMYEILWN